MHRMSSTVRAILIRMIHLRYALSWGLTAPVLASLLCARAGATGEIFEQIRSVPPALLAMDAEERKLVPSIRSSTFVRVRPQDILTRVQGAAALRLLPFTIGTEKYQARIRNVGSSLGHYRMDGWVGTDRIAISMNGTAVSAQIDTDTEVITVRSTGVDDIHVVHRHDPSRFDGSCGQTHAADTPKTPRQFGPQATTDVDVMVFYTPLAMKNSGGQAAMHAEVHLRITLANIANKASGVTWRWRLVHTGVTKYVEPNPVKLQLILSRFNGTTDGYMDEVHALRTYHGGDVMALICDGQNRDWGGYARCRSTKNSAFSITHRAGLAAHLLHHEMGHNLGLAHNRVNVDCRGSYSYSYGWRTKDNKFHTVMAYAGGTPRGKRINVWSSPKVKHLTYTMGTTSDDNARTLANRGPIVSGFFPTTTLEWLTLNGGIKGSNGIPELRGSGTTHVKAPPQVTFTGLSSVNPGVLVVGATTINVPLFGGLLVPTPDILVPMTSSGSFDASALNRLPTGTWIWFQGFFIHKSAVQGWAATHGVKVQTL